MTLKEQIQTDLNSALKAGDQPRRLTLAILMAAAKNKELEKRAKLSRSLSDFSELEKQSQLTDEEMEQVIAGEVKKRKESIEQFQKAGRLELAAKEEKEAQILTAYLPEPASEEEITRAIEEAVRERSAAGLSATGAVIGAVKAKLKNRAEGQMISQMVKKRLSP